MTTQIATEQLALLTAASASIDWQRRAVIEAARYSPFVTLNGSSWAGARLLIRANDDEDLEQIVSMVRSVMQQVSGIRYRREV